MATIKVNQPGALPKKSFFATIKHTLTKPRGSAAAKAAVEEGGEVVVKRPLLFRLTLSDQLLFAKRFSILLKAGVPIMQALQMLVKQTSNPSAKLVVKDLFVGVQRGQFLHVRMEKYRQDFGDFAVNIVRVGEVSGTLHENLSYLADELKKKQDLRRKVVSALVYPAFIVAATLGITILLITYVFPKILPVLQAFKGELPFTTRTLIFLSNLLTTKGWQILLGVMVLTAAWLVLYKRVRPVRLWVDHMSLKVPVFGKLLQSYHMANFCRTFGILLKSDVRIVEAAGVTSSTSTNLAYKDSLLLLVGELTRGGKLSDFLQTQPKLYPLAVGQMVTVGESTGKLSDTLLYLADIYETEVDDMTKNLSTAIEPMLMIFMGLLVGFIAMSIITPIYSLTQSLSR